MAQNSTETETTSAKKGEQPIVNPTSWATTRHSLFFLESFFFALSMANLLRRRTALTTTELVENGSSPSSPSTTPLQQQQQQQQTQRPVSSAHSGQPAAGSRAAQIERRSSKTLDPLERRLSNSILNDKNATGQPRKGSFLGAEESQQQQQEGGDGEEKTPRNVLDIYIECWFVFPPTPLAFIREWIYFPARTAESTASRRGTTRHDMKSSLSSFRMRCRFLHVGFEYM